MNYTLTPMKNEVFYQREWILDGRLDIKLNNLCRKLEKDFYDKYKAIFVALGVKEYDRYNMLNISVNRHTRGVHHSYEVMIGTRKFARNVNKQFFTEAHTRIDWDEKLVVPFFIQQGKDSEESLNSIDFVDNVNGMEVALRLYNQLKTML